jgi:hypothetical protein
MGDYFLYNWCKSENKVSSGGGGGGGGGGGEGCGNAILFFIACLALSAMCNNPGANGNYPKPSNPQIESVEDVDQAPAPPDLTTS